MKSLISEAAAKMGRVKSEAKTAAAKRNGAEGGRPKLSLVPLFLELHAGCGRERAEVQFPGEYRKARALGLIACWTDKEGKGHHSVDWDKAGPFIQD